MNFDFARKGYPEMEMYILHKYKKRTFVYTASALFPSTAFLR